MHSDCKYVCSVYVFTAKRILHVSMIKGTWPCWLCWQSFEIVEIYLMSSRHSLGLQTNTHRWSLSFFFFFFSLKMCCCCMAIQLWTQSIKTFLTMQTFRILLSVLEGSQWGMERHVWGWRKMDIKGISQLQGGTVLKTLFANAFKREIHRQTWRVWGGWAGCLT